MKGLKSLFEKFENAMSAAAFAEEGEFDTAREIMREENRPRKKTTKRIEAHLTVNAAK
ncbi:MAG: hypothetical protein HZA14_12030 [Nitrospirae bacterium]|nr:hypothetical protein [Nitrospirota bacterium]